MKRHLHKDTKLYMQNDCIYFKIHIKRNGNICTKNNIGSYVLQLQYIFTESHAIETKRKLIWKILELPYKKYKSCDKSVMISQATLLLSWTTFPRTLLSGSFLLGCVRLGGRKWGSSHCEAHTLPLKCLPSSLVWDSSQAWTRSSFPGSPLVSLTLGRGVCV